MCNLQVLQQCFESRDIEMLQKAVLELPKEDAEYHIKRCIDSGLWVPGGAEGEGGGEGEEGETEEGETNKDSKQPEEEIYDQVD